jgi:hypothetical protein
MRALSEVFCMCCSGRHVSGTYAVQLDFQAVISAVCGGLHAQSEHGTCRLRAACWRAAYAFTAAVTKTLRAFHRINPPPIACAASPCSVRHAGNVANMHEQGVAWLFSRKDSPVTGGPHTNSCSSCYCCPHRRCGGRTRSHTFTNTTQVATVQLCFPSRLCSRFAS